MDFDEIRSGSDPYDFRSFPGGGYADTDRDGLTNNYEIQNDTDPNDWDSDDDGISDGHKSPKWRRNLPNGAYVIQIPSATCRQDRKIGDYYYIWIRGIDSESFTGGIKVELTTSSKMTGEEILNYFYDTINNHLYTTSEEIPRDK